MNVIISLGIWVIVILATLFTDIAISFIAFFLRRFDPDGKLAHAQSFWWAKIIISVNPFWKFTISGIENIKKDTAYLLVSNHQSMADIILMCRTRRQFKWVAKESLFKVPLLGGCLSGVQNISLEREDYSSIKEVNKKMVYWLRRGISVCIFPEGTRSPDGKLQEFKNGGFKIAIKEKKDVVPIAIKGTYDALPKGSWIFKKKVYGEVKILPSVDVSGYEVKDFAILRDLVRDKIKSELMCH